MTTTHERAVIEAAERLVDIASRKGTLFVTQENGSDRLVGFFVPADAVTGLTRALVRLRTETPNREGGTSMASLRDDERDERLAAVAEELLGDARSLRSRLHACGLSEWTLGLDDLIAELARLAAVNHA